jgi:hypothetical protein
MSTATAPPTGATPVGARRWRAPALIGAALILATVLTITTSGQSNSTPLDPDNPGPQGSQALARVLAGEGVDVEVARSAAELEDLSIDADTGVIVVLPEYLGPATTERLFDHTADAARVLVVGVGPSTLDMLGDSTSLGRDNLGAGRDPGCTDPVFTDLRIEVDQAFTYGGADCYGGEGGALVRRPRPGLMFFGADQLLTNDQILRADNAAVALRLLGQDARLIWYVPALSDLAAGEAVTASSLLPPWIFPGLWVGGLAAIALVLWRARRLGPLSVEPLPVVVRASETTRSLGRLYRKAGDRAHAAAGLRAATRRRITDRLGASGMDASAGSEDASGMVQQIARLTGRDDSDVARLINPDPANAVPATDHDLITLARELAELDREVRRT